MTTLARRGPALLLFLLVLALWQAVGAWSRVPAWLLPEPTSIATVLVHSLGLLAPNLAVTLEEALGGFALSLILGGVAAVAMHLSRRLRTLFLPWIVISQTIPIVAIAPLLMVWFGFGAWSKVLVVILFAFFPITINLMDGLHSVPAELPLMMQTFGATRRQVFFTIELPWSLPALFTGMRMAITYAVIGAVIGEWVGAQAGLGYLLIRTSAQMQTALLFADVVLLALMGLALYGAIGLVQRRALAWHQERMVL